LIQKKVDEYLSRAEKLKAHIAGVEKPARVKVNDSLSGSAWEYK
jgi:hypothetical protein